MIAKKTNFRLAYFLSLKASIPDIDETLLEGLEDEEEIIRVQSLIERHDSYLYRIFKKFIKIKLTIECIPSVTNSFFFKTINLLTSPKIFKTTVKFNFLDLIFYTLLTKKKLQYRIMFSDKNFKTILNLTSMVCLKATHIKKKSLKKSLKAQALLFRKFNLILNSNKKSFLICRSVKKTFKEILSFFLKIGKKKPFCQNLDLLYIFLNPCISFGFCKRRRLRNIKKRLRKRIVKQYSKIPY